MRLGDLWLGERLARIIRYIGRRDPCRQASSQAVHALLVFEGNERSAVALYVHSRYEHKRGSCGIPSLAVMSVNVYTAVAAYPLIDETTHARHLPHIPDSRASGGSPPVTYGFSCVADCLSG